MNHPNREDWVPYIFGETKSEARRQLRQHLAACPECRAEMQSWKRSLGRLNAWQVAANRSAESSPNQGLRWAFAGCLVLGLACAFLLGRLTSQSRDEAGLRARLSTELKREIQAGLDQNGHEEADKMTAAMVAVCREEMQNLLSSYDRTVSARLEDERMQRLAAWLALKKDVDTIAVNADAGLRDTEQRLAQMAVYRQASRSSNPLTDSSTHH